MRFLRRWGHRQLLASWLAYWAILFAVVTAPAVARWWALQRSGEHGTVTLSYETGSLESLLWIAGPPLLLALAWLLSRPRREPPPPPAALPGEPLDEGALLARRQRDARRAEEAGDARADER